MEKCFYCGNSIGEDERTCRFCGADQKAYRMIMATSEKEYNDGLIQAKAHDLSGAIESLNRSVRFNKKNTKARDLLGLVYMKYGEPVLALREWVIAKNFDSEDELADRYLNSVSEDAGFYDKIDNATKKFNTAFKYARAKAFDLAALELKAVIKENPGMVKARQLLALIYIQSGEYQKAYAELKAAKQVDESNPLTTRYMKEVRSHLVSEKKKKRKERAERRSTVAINDGHDVVLMPRQTFIEALDNSKSGLFNILIGIAIGVLAFVFIVSPTIRQRENEETRKALITANSTSASSKSDVADLQKQVDELNTKLQKYEGKSDLKGSYENLLKAQLEATSDGDLDAASTALDKVNKKLLSTNGKTLYNSLADQIDQQTLVTKYSEGTTAFRNGKYSDAIDALKAVVDIDETYDNGEAMYELAEAYENNGDTKNALKYYKKVAKDYSNYYRGRNSASKVQQLQSADSSDTSNTTQ
ncbi:MAG: tetratricopeptide repeat protein [Candidatus Weimeria sp.]